MDYYKLLQLEREPFSNSPDPEYFFHSRQHLACLQKLELALRLKRGLNVVMGDVGTGKTTLCRELIRKFAEDPEIETHLILDPSIDTTEEFLKILHAMLCGRSPAPDASATQMKEVVKQTLYEKGVDQYRTVILIIDEGQKISATCIEILRELLNFETNTYKLLQIVIFAQKEFLTVLHHYPYFADRVNLLHILGPLRFADTRHMIFHRLKLSSTLPKPLDIFTYPALWAIYRYSQGYPRRIIHLCHQSVLAMIIQNRTRAGWTLVRSCQHRLAAKPRFSRRFSFAGLAIALLVAVLAYLRFDPILVPSAIETFKIPLPVSSHTPATLPSVASTQPESSLPAIKAATAAVDPSSPESPTAQGPAVTPATALVDLPEQTVDATPIQPVSAESTPPLPMVLGTLKVTSGDNLFNLISSVYGSYHHDFLDPLMRVNPDLKNPNAIATGAALAFPAIGFDARDLPMGAFWIALEEFDGLPTAFEKFKEYRFGLRLPVRMIARWSPERSTWFQLIVNASFDAEEKAQAYLQRLPASSITQARIVNDFPISGTILFDPDPARKSGQPAFIKRP